MPLHLPKRPARRAASAAAVVAVLLTTLTSVLAGAVVLMVSSPAGAHTELVATQPAGGARLAQAPQTVRLRFNEPVNASFARLTLRTGNRKPATLEASVRGETVTGTVPASVGSAERSTAQRWRVSYRVVSGDGHPIEGTITFAVAATSPSTATPTPTGSAEGAAPTEGGEADTGSAGVTSDAEDGSAGATSWVPTAVIGALALVSVAGVVGWLLRSRREHGSAP